MHTNVTKGDFLIYVKNEISFNPYKESHKDKKWNFVSLKYKSLNPKTLPGTIGNSYRLQPAKQAVEGRKSRAANICDLLNQGLCDKLRN